MKKIMTLMLAVVMMFGCVAPVSAADTADSTKDVIVQYAVDQTYEWAVPDTQEFSAITDTLSDGKVEVSNAVLQEDKEVKITVSSTNYSSGWRMKRGSDAYYMTYSMKKGDAEVENNGIVLEVQASTEAGAKASGEQALTFAITDSDKAGSFSDTLTFSAAIVNAGEGGESSSLQFSIDETTYSYVDGMTFGDWIDSEYNVDGYKLLIDIKNAHYICTADSLIGTNDTPVAQGKFTGYCITTNDASCVDENTVISDTTYYKVEYQNGLPSGAHDR